MLPRAVFFPTSPHISLLSDFILHESLARRISVRDVATESYVRLFGDAIRFADVYSHDVAVSVGEASFINPAVLAKNCTRAAAIRPRYLLDTNVLDLAESVHSDGKTSFLVSNLRTRRENIIALIFI